MKDLALLHDKHMNRPTLDDSSEEEHAIEITTQEITQVLQSTSAVICIFFFFFKCNKNSECVHSFVLLFSYLLHFEVKRIYISTC